MAEVPEPQPLLVVPEWTEAHCVVPDGFRRGRPFLLYDFQFRYLTQFYLVRGDAEWLPEDPILAPAFVYRRGMLVDPQKKGKGPLSAAHICVEGVGPALFAGWAGRDDGYACSDHGCGCGWEYGYRRGEPMGMPWPTPLIQVTALSEEQTDNIYGALRPMIEFGPLADVIPKTGEEFIRLPGGGRIDTVTSSAQSRLGQRITFAPQDETGLWTVRNKMAKVADTQYRGLAGMGGRASLTTNAWDPAENSVAQQQFESSAQDVYRQFVQPPKSLSYTNKRDRRKIHTLVYGEALKQHGGHVDLDAIEAEAADLLERDPGQAERFFGNRLVAGLNAFLDQFGLAAWEKSLVDQAAPDSGPVCLAFDGSDSDDWTSIRAETMDGWQFTPRVGPDGRPSVWNPAEFGGRIPRGEVDAAVDELFTRFTVVRMYCDPPDWSTEVENWALRYGEAVTEWPTYRTNQMHAVLQRFLIDLQSGRLTHDACQIAATHLGNARKVAKPAQKYLLGKPTQHQKIDHAMTSTLVHEAVCDALAAGWTNEPQDRRVIVFR
jgi:hypothetical protein